MLKRLFVFLVVVFLFILALSGCSKPVPRQSSVERTIKIGLILPTKGDLETYGTLSKNGIDLAVEDVNDHGGILGRKIEVLPGVEVSSGDSAGDKGNAGQQDQGVWQSIINQFSVQKVSAIVGPYTDQSSLKIAPIANAYGLPMVAIRASKEDVTHFGPYIFRACYVNAYQGTILGRFAGQDLKLKKVAVMYDTGDSGVKALIDNFKQELAKPGGILASKQSYDENTTDFTSQIRQIAKENPDGILLTDFGDKDGLIIKRAREMGLKCTFLGTDLWDAEKLYKTAGDAAVGSYFSTHFSPDDPDKKVQEFVELYKSDYGTKPGPSAALSYDAMTLVMEAIKQANSDNPAKIREELTKMKIFRGVTGTFEFDEFRNPLKGGTIMKIEQNAQVFVKHIEQ